MLSNKLELSVMAYANANVDSPVIGYFEVCVKLFVTKNVAIANQYSIFLKSSCG